MDREVHRKTNPPAILELAEKHGVDMEKGGTLFDLAGFVADLEDLLGVKVDAVTLLVRLRPENCE